MSGRTRKTLVATAPDGTEVTQETSGGYDTAGLIQRQDGTWFIAARGWSRQSVYDRTHARYNRGDYRAMHVSDLTEATAPIVREYFGTHFVGIGSLYSPGAHEGLTEAEAREVLRIEGANMDEVTGAILVARDHPGKKDAGVQAGGAIAGITYADGKFTVEMQAGWRRLRGHGAGRSALRQILRHGWTGVAFTHCGRVADFQDSELRTSMNAKAGAR